MIFKHSHETGKKSLNKQIVTYNIIHLMLYLNKERLMVLYQVAIKEEGTYSDIFSHAS